MGRRFFVPTALVLFAMSLILLGTCRNPEQPSGDRELSGRILLWHTWSEAEAAVLDEVLTRFEEINPGVQISTEAFEDRDEMLEQFRDASASGLGPDVMLGPSSWIRPLARAGFLTDIDRQFSAVERQEFLSTVMPSVLYDGRLYGLPESLRTVALFYNRNLVDAPATTLEAWLTQAADGAVVLMSSRLSDSFWGVNAFGGRILSEDGRVILNQGGFANWITWLKQARDAPGMIVDANREALRNRFVEGGAAYLVADGGQLRSLQNEMGKDVVGVAELPAGPNGSAGPLLDVEAIMFNSASSPNQSAIALTLARFLTNVEQSATFMRKAGRVPANVRLRLNPRLDPDLNILAKQTRTAILFPPGDQADTIRRLLRDEYTRALEGVTEPAVAAQQVTQAMNLALGVAERAGITDTCQDEGTVNVGYVGGDDLADVLQSWGLIYTAACPGIHFEVVSLDEEEVAVDATTSLQGLDLLVAPARMIPSLVLAQSISPVDAAQQSERLQRYRPKAVDALRYGDSLYGLPMAVNVSALFYNRQLVDEPAHSLGDMLTQVGNGVPISLDVSFDRSYWGLGGFGGAALYEALYLPAVVDSFEKWLNWLQAAEDEIEILNREGDISAWDRFVDGESAYYVGTAVEGRLLKSSLRGRELGVSQLPNGPEGKAVPLLSATGFLFPGNVDVGRRHLAISFVDFASGAGNQMNMWRNAGLLPAIAGIEAGDDKTLNVFLEQLRSATPVPLSVHLPAIVELGNQVYLDVLEKGRDPQEALAEMVDAFELIMPASAAGGVTGDTPQSGEGNQ